MFLEACVKNSVHRGRCAWGGACMARGGCAWLRVHGGVCGRGANMVEGMRGRGGHAWQEIQPLQRTVRILLECILVSNCFFFFPRSTY